MKEEDIISKYFRPISNKKIGLNLQDDTAFLYDEKLLVNVDAIVENQHFFSYDPISSIVTKLLETNLSDIAAMGGIPLYWTFSLTFNKNKKGIEDFVKKLSIQIEQIQNKYNFKLIGGDLTYTFDESMVLSANMFAKPKEHILTKHKANAGDYICISNNVGDSFWGLYLQYLHYSNIKNRLSFLSQNEIEKLINIYMYPKSQLQLGQILSDYDNIAATDISDGLITNLNQICISSNVDVLLYKNTISFSSEVTKILSFYKDEGILSKTMNSGGDYELLFTVPEELFSIIEKKALYNNINIQQIGKVVGKHNPIYNNNYIHIK